MLNIHCPSRMFFHENLQSAQQSSAKSKRKATRRGSRSSKKGPIQYRIKASNRAELERWVEAIQTSMGSTSATGRPLEGWLFRKTKSIFKAWQKRWFLLSRGPNGCMLSYYFTSAKAELRNKWAVSDVKMGPRSAYAIVTVEDNGEPSYKVKCDSLLADGFCSMLWRWLSFLIEWISSATVCAFGGTWLSRMCACVSSVISCIGLLYLLSSCRNSRKLKKKHAGRVVLRRRKCPVPRGTRRPTVSRSPQETLGTAIITHSDIHVTRAYPYLDQQ